MIDRLVDGVGNVTSLFKTVGHPTDLVPSRARR
jgi:hypothetical protein